VFWGGGAAPPPHRPERQLARAETGIEFAEQSGAAEYGQAALGRARTELAMAWEFAEEGEYELALQAAERAELDAELAAAQTNRRKAEDALGEINASIETLRREIAREQTGYGGES
jgi:tetratricopeptide (TPR) repeat protein